MSFRAPGKPVLVVEDDRSTRELFALGLKSAGFQVSAVGNGLDALRRIDLSPPALIVLDLGLPMLHGRDVLREVAATAGTSHIPIVVVTGSDVSELDPEEVACVMRKPVDPEVLVEAVIRCLAQASRSEPV